jgi:hypothetical protein
MMSGPNGPFQNNMGQMNHMNPQFYLFNPQHVAMNSMNMPPHVKLFSFFAPKTFFSLTHSFSLFIYTCM